MNNLNFKNEVAKKEWDISRSNNQDSYGKGVVDFCERWANLMEMQITNGKKLTEIASDTEKEADTDGITGFMYGCAIDTLSQVWKYGDELKAWHNRKYMYEGEGVVNPVILSMDKDD